MLYEMLVSGWIYVIIDRDIRQLNVWKGRAVGTPHLYNIRIIRSYVEYIEKYYPEADVNAILDHAGLTRYEMEDLGYWFTQEQADRFFEAVVQKTGNPGIAREAGRMEATSSSYDTFRQYVYGFITPAVAYDLCSKISAKLTRGATMEHHRMGRNKVEIVSRPIAGVNEKPYQCENRLGVLEAIPKPFTGKYAQVEHPECIHKGGTCCRYVISWDEPRFFFWKKMRNIAAFLSIIVCLAAALTAPQSLLHVIPGCFAAIFILAFYAEYTAKKELARNAVNQGNAAEMLLHEINVRYNDALLIQEIGQAISMVLDIDELIDYVMQILRQRSNYDRGLVLLANENQTRLICMSGYGYAQKEEQLLRRTRFTLDKKNSKGPFVQAFRDQKPCLVNDINEVIGDMSPRSQDLARFVDVRSLVCVPIVFKGESLGILSVDNMKSKDVLSQSEVSLLTGIAQQIGISINNARFFKRLQESEAKYRELVENANSILMRIDIDGRISFFNEFAQRFFDYRPEEVVGSPVIGKIMAEDSSSARIFRGLFQNIESSPENYSQVQAETVLKNGERVWISWTNKAIRDEDGNVAEVLCVGTDITEQKRLEAQLRQSQKMEAIGTLAGGIAHDFNNILFPIIGYAEMSMDDVPDGSIIKANLEEIRRAACRAKELVEQILVFSRQSEQEKRPLRIQPVVKEVLKLLRASLPSTIRIDCEIDEKCGAVLADPTHIHQVMMNLCTNASYAMKHDGGVMTVRLDEIYVDQADDGSGNIEPGLYACLTVNDTGDGIDADLLEKIFDPYFTTKGPGDGSGMGLAVVHGIVKNGGGHVTVESVPEVGSTFRVFLPRIDAEAQELPRVKYEDIPGGDEHIMVVDDEEFIVHMEKQLLERLGYKVSAFTSSLDALDVFSMQPEMYDLIITDQTMPDLTGMEFSRKVLMVRPGIPIILCTGFSSAVSDESVKAVGIRDYVMKPIAKDEFGHAIRKVLDS